MYTLLRIDLLDAHIHADVFDDDAYAILKESDNLEEVIILALYSFQELNPNYKSGAYWHTEDADMAYDIEIVSPERKSLFRGNMLLAAPYVSHALMLAHEYHAGQTRKGDGLPYIIHILEISRLLHRHRMTPEILAAGLCHDLLEDTDCPPEKIAASCTDEVLRIVQAVSNDPELEGAADWERKKKAYIASVRAGGEKAMAVCCADKIVNLQSLLRAHAAQGDAVWRHFNRGKEQKLWFEQAVLQMLRENWDHPLIELYTELVGKMVDIAQT